MRQDFCSEHSIFILIYSFHLLVAIPPVFAIAYIACIRITWLETQNFPVNVIGSSTLKMLCNIQVLWFFLFFNVFVFRNFYLSVPALRTWVLFSVFLYLDFRWSFLETVPMFVVLGHQDKNFWRQKHWKIKRLLKLEYYKKM